jgi:spore germination protein (amino acid permease)
MVPMVNSKVSFGKWEGILLIINSICVQIFLNYPGRMSEDAGAAGWMIPIYNAVIVFFLFYLISKLLLKYEGKDLLDISQEINGNVTKVLVGILLSIYIIFIIVLVLREFAEGIKIISLTKSPLGFILILLLTGMVIGSYFGPEAIVRFHAIMVPMIIIGFCLIIIGVVPYYNFNNLFPILGKGGYSIIIKGFSGISTYSPLVFLLLITPFIKTNHNLKRVGTVSIITAGFFLTVSVVSFVSAFSYQNPSEQFIPIYQMARLIQVPEVFERIEVVFLFIWVISVLLFLNIVFYFLIYIFSKALSLEYIKPLIIPFAILVLSLSALPEDYLMVRQLYNKYFNNYVWIITFGLVFMILIIANLKRRKKKIE